MPQCFVCCIPIPILLTASFMVLPSFRRRIPFLRDAAGERRGIIETGNAVLPDVGSPLDDEKAQGKSQIHANPHK